MDFTRIHVHAHVYIKGLNNLLNLIQQLCFLTLNTTLLIIIVIKKDSDFLLFPSCVGYTTLLNKG